MSKKLILLSCLLWAFFYSSPLYASWSNTNLGNGWTGVVSISCSGANGCSTSAVNTSTANLLVVGVQDRIDLNSSCSPSDTIGGSASGNTWTPVTGYSDTSSISHTRFWYVDPSAVHVGANHVVTCTATTAQSVIIFMAIKSAANSPVDTQNGLGQLSGTTTIIKPCSSAPCISPIFGNELILTNISANVDISSINSSFAIVENVADSGGNNFGGAVAYLTQSTAANESPTWTIASSTGFVSNGILSFKQSGTANAQHFLQQPTTTHSGSPFSNTVTVYLTSTTVDSMTLSVSTGTCALTGTTTVNSSGGSPNIATFTGVGVTGTPTTGCILTSHDSTDMTVTDVTSDSFNMTGAIGTCSVTIDPDHDIVATAVMNAADGDTICLNAKTVTYTSSIDLSVGGTKAVEIRGAGYATSLPLIGSAGQTIINVGTPNIFGAFPQNHSIIVDNIRFQSSINHFSTPIISMASVRGQQPFIVHHNDFIFTGTCSGIAVGGGYNNSVVYRNNFKFPNATTDCPSGNTDSAALEDAITDDGSQWASASTFGSADTTGHNNTYFETNYLENYNVALDHSTAARTVWRFNQLHNATVAGHGFDSGTGPRGLEVYNNTWFCDEPFTLGGGYLNQRGGTGFIGNNTFPAYNSSNCGNFPGSSTASPISMDQFNTWVCDATPGWPGGYNASFPNYPISHQVGWGWNGSFITVGASSGVNLPGTQGWPMDGFEQALEPYYTFANTNGTGGTMTNIVSNKPGNCRMMAYSNATKASGTHLVIPASIPANRPVPYATVGEQIVAILADNVGGTTPTIDWGGACSSTTTLTAGTNGAMRLSAWTCTATASGQFTATFTTDSSTSARAGTILVFRNPIASPVDKNPAVCLTCNSSPYNTPFTGTLHDDGGGVSNEVVVGYYALAGPLSISGGSLTDNIAVGSSDSTPFECFDVVQPTAGCGELRYLGFNGTSSGSNDVLVATSYRVVNATTSIQSQLMDTTANRNGLTGVVTFRLNGSTANLTSGRTPLDVEPSDYIAYDREYYDDCGTNSGTNHCGGSFAGTSGTGWGPRNSRPASTTNGVAWWATDAAGGNWNNGSSTSGCLDIVQSNAWVNCVYTPYTYPHPNATVIGGGNSQFFSQQPTSIQSGKTFSPTITVTVTPPAADSITLTSSTGALSGITTVTSNATTGIAVFSGVGIAGLSNSATITATNNTDLTISPVTSNVFAITCAPTKVVFTSQPTGASLGASLGTVKVTEEDNSGNICSLASDTITLSKDAGATWGTLVSASNLAKAASAGVATWTDLSVTTTAGSGSIDATSPGLTSAISNSITISGGGCTPDHLTFIAQPQNALIGQNVGTIQVAVKDAGGNTCNDTSTVTLAKHAGTCTGMTLNGTVSGSAVAGVFLTSNVNLTVATGTCQLDATDGALTSATSNSFNITAPASGAGGRAGMVLRRGRH